MLPYNPGVPTPEDHNAFSLNPLSLMWDFSKFDAQFRSLGFLGTGLIQRHGSRNVFPTIGAGKSPFAINLMHTSPKYASQYTINSPGLFGIRGLFRPASERGVQHGVWNVLNAPFVKGTKWGAALNQQGLAGAVFGAESKTTNVLNSLVAGSGKGLAVSKGVGRVLAAGQIGFSLYTYAQLAGWMGKTASQGIYGLSSIAGMAAGRMRGDLGTRFSTQMQDHFYTAQSATERSNALRVIQEAHSGGFRPSYGNEASLMHRTFGR